MLYALPPLDTADLQVLDELNAMRTQLHRHLRSRPRWEGQFRRSLFAAAIQGSNTIEHITISGTDARALVENAPMPGAVDDETQQAVIGYRDAMTYVQRCAGRAATRIPGPAGRSSQCAATPHS